MNNRVNSLDTNTVSRYRNQLIGALLDKKVLPKIVVIIPDDDIINFIEDSFDAKLPPKEMGHVLNWLMNEYDKLISIHKENLPAKAKRAGYPQILWIEPPLHDNFLNNRERESFNSTLSTVAQFHPDTWVLKLKKIWDPNDNSLYMKEEQRFTAAGLKSYWDAVDKTVRYADTILLKKPEKHKQQNAKPVYAGYAQQNTNECRNDKYHWSRKHPPSRRLKTKRTFYR